MMNDDIYDHVQDLSIARTVLIQPKNIFLDHLNSIDVTSQRAA